MKDGIDIVKIAVGSHKTYSALHLFGQAADLGM
jgi:hypothetical protein